MKNAAVSSIVFGIILIAAGLALALTGEPRLPVLLVISGSGLFVGGAVLIAGRQKQ